MAAEAAAEDEDEDISVKLAVVVFVKTTDGRILQLAAAAAEETAMFETVVEATTADAGTAALSAFGFRPTAPHFAADAELAPGDFCLASFFIF
jgi:hypothetical protein